MRKKSQTGIIVVVILIILALVSIVILWNVVNEILKNKTGEINPSAFVTRIDIGQNPTINNNCVNLTVKRESGGKSLSEIRFIFKNDSDVEGHYTEKDESKLPKELESKQFNFCYPVDIQVSNVTRVSFVPVYGSSYGIVSEESEIQVINLDVIPISSCSELQNMRFNLTANYQLINDIDCSDTINWNNGTGFIPIASGTTQQSSCSGNAFIGSLDGRGHRIFNLYINNYSGTCLGLFGDFGGNVSNVGIVNVTIIANSSLKVMAGGITASSYGNIKNSYAIYNIYTKAYGGSAFIGGLVGDNRGNITNSYSIGNLSGGTYATYFSTYMGGLVGLITYGNISNCYSISDIKLSDGSSIAVGGIGGLVGKAYPNIWGGGVNKYIDNSFTVTNLNLNYSQQAGSLIGLSDTNLLMTNVYWNNNSKNLPIGCYYYNTTQSGNNNCVAIHDNPEYFYSKSNLPMVIWDFDNTWKENPSDYPSLLAFV